MNNNFLKRVGAVAVALAITCGAALPAGTVSAARHIKDGSRIKEQAKEQSKETAKEQPKEAAKEQPKAQVKEQVKEPTSRQTEQKPRGRAIEVEATAYSPDEPGLGDTTAMGTKVRKGVIAVDPDFIPLGTRVFIPGYGEAVAEDTGGAIIGNIIDIAFDNYEEMEAFGRQYIVIYLLDEVEETAVTEKATASYYDSSEEDSSEGDAQEDETEADESENEKTADDDEESDDEEADDEK